MKGTEPLWLSASGSASGPQKIQVLSALPKAGHRDRKGIDPKIEVLTKTALLHHPVQVPMGRTDEPRVGPLRSDAERPTNPRAGSAWATSIGWLISMKPAKLPRPSKTGSSLMSTCSKTVWAAVHMEYPLGPLGLFRLLQGASSH